MMLGRRSFPFGVSVTFQGELSNLRLDMTNLEKTPLKTQSLSQFSENEKNTWRMGPMQIFSFCPYSKRARRLPFIAAVGKGGYIPRQDLRVSCFQVWFHEEFWGSKKSRKYGRKRRWHPDIGKIFLKTTFWGRSLPSTVGRIYHTYLNYCGLWRLEILDPTQKKKATACHLETFATWLPAESSMATMIHLSWLFHP